MCQLVGLAHLCEMFYAFTGYRKGDRNIVRNYTTGTRVPCRCMLHACTGCRKEPIENIRPIGVMFFTSVHVPLTPFRRSRKNGIARFGRELQDLIAI